VRQTWGVNICVVWLAFLVSAFGWIEGALTRCHAEDDSAIQAALGRADADLNAVYKDVMAELPVGRREQLRLAERAWIVFSDKNNAALRLAAQKLGLSLGRVRIVRLAEIQARSAQLRQMRAGPPTLSNEQLLAKAQASDAALNQVYASARQTLDAQDKELLRDAQRAWIAFRDEHAKAQSSRAAAFAALVALTEQRVAQLREFYLSERRGLEIAGPSRSESPATDRREPQIDPTTPDPFKSAR
jgi:uncharacterized protein YecT (DUF1311 family)